MKEKEIKYRRHSDYELKGAPLGTYIKEPEWIHVKFIVKTEEEKEELLKASEYLHNFCSIGYNSRFGKLRYESLDSDIMAVNWFMHLYTTPDAIEVKPNEEFLGFKKES
jgi:hypothetical protein